MAIVDMGTSLGVPRLVDQATELLSSSLENATEEHVAILTTGVAILVTGALLLLGYFAICHTSRPNTALWDAVAAGWRNEVQRLLGFLGEKLYGFLGELPFLNVGETALHRAVSHAGVPGVYVNLLWILQEEDSDTHPLLAEYLARVAIVELLLTNGTDFDAKKPDGTTALWIAASNGHDAIVKLLLAKGARVDVKGPLGLTALLCAAFNGHGTVMELLLAKGADVNIMSDSEEMALHLACERGNESTVEMLLGRGADVHARNVLGDTPEEMASRCGHEHIVAVMRAFAKHRAKFEAFAMGQHERLGARSLILGLEQELVRLILDQM